MAQLTVEDDLVRELEQRAERNGRSVEEEHRQILRNALQPNNPGSSLKELLSQMPEGAEDEDFRRVDDLGRPADL